MGWQAVFPASVPDNRWPQLTALFHAALARDPSTRDAYLNEVCQGDGPLREELHRLLVAHASGESFLQPPLAAPLNSPRLDPGSQLGPYTITGFLGAGGMGDVYRARDARLGRDIAIKLLPPEAAVDAERRARFAREAQALAALNHPNIVTIYSVERGGDLYFLTIELVAGKTLRELIPRGGLPTDRFLEIGICLADAVGTAHGHQVVHRDLKPSNVMITSEGRVKVLDFGLAKLKAPPVAVGDLTTQPTFERTADGRILGTLDYMSPEQIEGREVDHRSDIFSLGIVLYEMATGQRPFTGESSAALISSILTDAPPLVRAVRPGLPQALDRIIRRCLAKEPDRRYQSAIDLRSDLEEAREAPSPAMALQSAIKTAPSLERARPWRWIAATVTLGLALFALFSISALVRPRDTIESLETAIDAPAGTEFAIGVNSGVVALSPDGTRIAFVASNDKSTAIWVRSLARDDARMLPGTEGASNQFWSPDSRRIGFFARGKLWTVDVTGGLPDFVANAPSGRGATWSDDGTIIFTPMSNSPLFRVAAVGGPVTQLTTLDETSGERAHAWASFLPDGKRYLYFVNNFQTENSGIYLGNLDGSPARRLVASQSSAIVVKRASADEWFLLWAPDNNLLAQRFDLASGTLSGAVSTIAEGVRVDDNVRLVYVTASRLGHLAWARAAESVLALRSREGRLIRWLVTAEGNFWPALSPDDTQVLFTRTERGFHYLYRHDLKSTVTTRFITTPAEGAKFSADGRAVMYWAYVDRKPGGLLRLELSSGARPVPVTLEGFGFFAETPDGHIIVKVRGGGTPKVMAYAPPDFKTGVAIANVPADSSIVGVSPDGWALVRSGASPDVSIAVARLEAMDGRFSLGPLQVAAERVSRVDYRRDFKEMFVTMLDGELRAIEIRRTADNVSFGAPQTLFRVPLGTSGISVNADGTQFVIAETPNAIGQTIRLLTRWDQRVR